MCGKENATEKIVMIHQSKLIDFEDNPFKVVFDEKMNELIESIKEKGVLTPITVRPKDNNYEILSGQRRVAACRTIGVELIPTVIKDIDDNEAAILLVDSNLQREELLFSEKAFAYKLKLDAMKCQGKRTDLTSDQVGRKSESREVLADQVGEIKSQISRYIRLTELSVEIGKCLNGESAFTTDVLTMSINSTKDELKAIDQRLPNVNNHSQKKAKS